MAVPLLAALAPALAGAVAGTAIKEAPGAIRKVVKGVNINELHERNRKKCGMSIKEYRRRGGYKSRTPLCERACYQKGGQC